MQARPLLSTLLVALSLGGLLAPAAFAGPSEPSAASAASSSGAASSAPAAPAAEGRVIVLGFDGADARTIRELMQAEPERYPTFARLARDGSFESLVVEAPPESPVSWAALNTGQNPAKTGVPGFIKRNLSSRGVSPGFGHLGKEDKPAGEFTNLPIPAMSPTAMAAALGGGAFLVVLLLFLLLLRKPIPAAVLALVAGAGGAYAGHTAAGWLPETFPRSTNPNKARNLWDFAADAGKRAVVIDAAQAFDMPTPEGARVLGGLGVPDARGAIGDWFVYTTNPEETKRLEQGGRDTGTAGTVYRVDFEGGAIDTKLFGPENFWMEQKLQARIAALDEQLKDPSIKLEKSMDLSSEKRDLSDELKRLSREPTSVDVSVRVVGDKAQLTMDGQTQEIAEGDWSDFYELTFELNPILNVKALTRVRILNLEQPYFSMFVNVLDIDPREPPFWQAISQPYGFSGELAHECDMLYETYGWSTATMPFKDKVIPAEVLMEDVEFTMKWREQLTKRALARADFDLFMSVFSTTDRVQHMMYQYFDESHPMYDAAEADQTFEFFGETIRRKDAIPAIYQQMDRIIGEILDEFVGADDTLLVCSDHGFQTFRRQVHVNNWLAENGYLAIKPGLNKGSSKYLQFVDWANTRAYSLGMGFIYVNLKGREFNGQVEPSERDALLREIGEKFLQARDPDNPDKPVCEEYYITSEIHNGPYLDLESDMILGIAPTYRVSWASTGGGLSVTKSEDGTYVPAPICSDNDSPWSGGHVSLALPHVSGVFLSNRKVQVPEGGVRLLQMAPTALDRLGVSVPSAMDLPALSFR